MANEFLNNRVAAASFSFPANVAGDTSLTLSQNLVGLYLPNGAIVTRVGFLLGAQTEIASMKDATFNISVSNVALLSNNVKASVVMTVGVAATGTLGLAPGVYVPTGGQAVMHFASSDNARSGINVAGTAYVGYIAK